MKFFAMPRAVAMAFGVALVVDAAGSLAVAADPQPRPRVQTSRQIAAPRVTKARPRVAQPSRKPVTTKRTNPVRPPVAVPAANPTVVTGAY